MSEYGTAAGGKIERNRIYCSCTDDLVRQSCTRVIRMAGYKQFDFYCALLLPFSYETGISNSCKC